MRYLCCFCVVVVLSGCAGGGAAAKAEVRTREELRAALAGKSKEEVRKALGKPEWTKDYSDGTESWDYKRVSYDPEAGRTDGTATVWFGKDGAVYRVSF